MLRRPPRARRGKGGKRELVQVLRLPERFFYREVRHSVRDALRSGTITFDGVKRLLLRCRGGRPPRNRVIRRRPGALLTRTHCAQPVIASLFLTVICAC